MNIRNYENLTKYYVDIYLGSGNFTKEHAETKVKEFLNSGSWAPIILGRELMSVLDELGKLNVGICPMCGDSPIGNDKRWEFKWKFKPFGPKINVCQMCYQENR